jgi:hypothetical protein
MKLFSPKRKGCIVLGKDIKCMIDQEKGVLVYDGEALKFIAIDDLIIRSIRECNDKKSPKIVLISDEFNQVSKLEDNKEYLVEFGDYGMEFWDTEHKNLEAYVDGILIVF